jgi:hypothetical protein
LFCTTNHCLGVLWKCDYNKKVIEFGFCVIWNYEGGVNSEQHLTFDIVNIKFCYGIYRHLSDDIFEWHKR